MENKFNTHTKQQHESCEQYQIDKNTKPIQQNKHKTQKHNTSNAIQKQEKSNKQQNNTTKHTLTHQKQNEHKHKTTKQNKQQHNTFFFLMGSLHPEFSSG